MGIGASQQAHSCDECYACELSPLARGSCAGGRSKKAVFSFFSPELDTQYCTHFASMFSKIDVYQDTD